MASSATAHSAPPTPAEDANRAVPFTKEGENWIATFSSDASRRKLDVDLLHTLTHESVVCCVRFSPDGRYLATGCNHLTKIYDTLSGTTVLTLSDDTTPTTQDLYIRSVCFSPDGRHLATGAEDGKIRVWSIHTPNHTLFAYEAHTSEIYTLDYSPDGRRLVSGSGDKTVRIWGVDPATGMPATTPLQVFEINEPDQPTSVDGDIAAIAISPNSRFVAAASIDHVIRIYDIEAGTRAARLSGHGDSVYGVAFTPDGTALVSGSLDKTLKVWDVSPLHHHHQRECRCTATLTGHEDYILSVAVSRDANPHARQWLISSSKDRCVRFWDHALCTSAAPPGAARAEFTLKGHRNSVIAVDASPAGGMFATAGGDWDAKIWRYTTLR